jgi:phosphoenolpyruvate carboxylase
MIRFAFAPLLLACTLAPTSSAQSPDSASLQALVTEIHQLRLALEHAGATTPKIQITLLRLQLQEQKVTRISEQLADVRRQISALSQQTQYATLLQNLDAKIAQEQDAIRRKPLEEQRRNMNAAMEQQTRMLQDLRAQEAEQAGALRTEQAKADELNDHLNALERSLDAPPLK